jgi:hypothetical protein
MRSDQCLPVVAIFVASLLSGCLSDGTEEATGDLTENQNNSANLSGSPTAEGANSIDGDTPSISFGGATFNTSTWE